MNLKVTDDPQTATTNLVTFPTQDNLPDVQPKRPEKPAITNFAENEETVSKFLIWANAFLTKFDEQPARKKAEEGWDSSDEMIRVAKTRTQTETDQSDNDYDTRSNVSSTMFWRIIRAMSTGEAAIILGNEEEIPVKYEPLAGAVEYAETEGLRIAKRQNALMSYTFDVDNMRDKISELIFYTNKYNDQFIEMGWDEKRVKQMVRMPSEWETINKETGQPLSERRPIKWKTEEKEIVIADNPTMIRHDLKDVWFDPMIDDIQDQSCIILRKQVQMADVVAQYTLGKYLNVDKIKSTQLYKGESPSTVKAERQANADEDQGTEESTTLLDRYIIWMRSPINKKGDWKEKELCTWHVGVFIGRLEESPVCVYLSPNPYYCKRLGIPFQLVHVNPDDKGAYHSGHRDRLQCLYMQETTTFNQQVDNVTKIVNKPLIAEKGAMSVRDFMVVPGGNRVMITKVGAKDPHELEIQNTTAITIPLLNLIKSYADDTAGLNQAYMGQPLGGRTSASEARLVFEQALKPALEDSKYKARQILPFIAEWTEELWRQFGDPARTYFVTYENESFSVQTTDLWGPLQVRVTSIRNFQDGIIKQQMMNQFINSIFPQFKGYMSNEGVIDIGKQVLKTMDFERVDRMWKIGSDAPIRGIARKENDAILFEGIDVPVNPEDNDEVHLSEHEPFFASYTGLPKEQRNEQNIFKMKMHIQAHESKQSQSARSAPVAAPVPAGQGAQPRIEGEAVGDMTGAMEGATENLPTPEMTGGA